MALQFCPFSKYSKGKTKVPPQACLESLPPELLLGLFEVLPTFKELNALISASPVCLRVFNAFTNTTINRKARKIIGPGAWSDSITTLILHRNCPGDVPDHSRLLDELKKGFIFETRDIVGIMSNERVYRACAKKFREDCRINAPYLNMPFAVRGPTATSPPIRYTLKQCPGFPNNGVLPRRHFYRVWVYCLAMRFEELGFPIDYRTIESRIQLRIMGNVMKSKKVRKVADYELSVGYKEGPIPHLSKRMADEVKLMAQWALSGVGSIPREIIAEIRQFNIECLDEIFWYC